MPELIFNPFHPPPPGSDDPHQGVDFADLDPSGRISQEGRPVQAVLGDQVAAIIKDQVPLRERRVDRDPIGRSAASLVRGIKTPHTETFPAPIRTLTCPDPPQDATPTASGRSLYVLYAHLQGSPGIEPNQIVACGQSLGAVGGAGNALNPHLHLEVRIGPSGNRFASTAHYDPGASPDEMANYCAWRVGGLYQLVDPMALLTLSP